MSSQDDWLCMKSIDRFQSHLLTGGFRNGIASQTLCFLRTCSTCLVPFAIVKCQSFILSVLLLTLLGSRAGQGVKTLR